MFIENNYVNTFVQQFRPRAGSKIYAVKAGMGTGKTSQLKKFIQEHPTASFLVVSSRVSLSHVHFGILSKFEHYSSRK